MIDEPHPNAGKQCLCKRGYASGYDGKCGFCRSARERKAVERMRDGWSREDAARGFRSPQTMTDALRAAVNRLERLAQ
jgi:hypothetical protein